MNEEHLWWQRGVIYQIYPRSFQDSNGDGVGDLRGITQKLEYLAWLGVDAIWISPFYPSPMADFGYDVSNYKDIDPMFGTLADFDGLVAEAHRLGLKVILDYVPNHTSDEHPWFVESRSSRDNPKRDWYIWRDARPDGSPPNNWLSEFGGPAWKWDEATGQFYYRAYHEKQPDLDWRNAEVREAMLDVLRFWMERGADGFRVDALRNLIEDEKLRDDPPNPGYREGDAPNRAQNKVHSADRPEVHEMTAMMRRLIEDYGGRVLIGELYLPIERLMAYYGEDSSGVHMPTNMHLILTPWNARRISALIEEYEAALPPGGWPNWALGNHDNSRVASRLGAPQARVAAMLLLTLRGTPTIYYGDEIGMPDGKIPPELAQDPVEKSAPGHGRDPERTPMQWDATPNADFTTGHPWLPIAEGHESINVLAQSDDSRSILTLYRRLLALRRAEPALAVSSYRRVFVGDDVLVYLRENGEGRFMVALNFGSEARSLELDVWGCIALSTALDREGEEVAGALSLRGDEGVIISL